MLDEETKGQYIALGLALNPEGGDIEDLQSIEWGKIKEIQGVINIDFTLDIMLHVCSTIKDIKNIEELKWTKLFPFYNFILAGLKKISKLEERLSYEPTIYELSAGIEDYNQYGIFVTIDRLAGGDPLKYEQITKLPYNIVFSKLLLNLTDSNFQKKYSEIINNRK